VALRPSLEELLLHRDCSITAVSAVWENLQLYLAVVWSTRSSFATVAPLSRPATTVRHASGTSSRRHTRKRCWVKSSPSLRMHLINRQWAITWWQRRATLWWCTWLTLKLQPRNFERDRDSKSESRPVAFFHATAPISALECAGEKITVGCKIGQVSHLRAAFLLV